MKQLIAFIEQFVKLSPEAVEELYKRASTEIYTKNDHILSQGQRCDKIWYIKSGMVRKYHLYDGKEITSWIHTENEIFTSLESYSTKNPANEFLQASENTEVISISRENSKKLANFPVFTFFSTVLMEREFVNIDRHTKAFNQKDARDRYAYLSEIAPEIIKRAKLGHISSILGISQETLSRIRSSKP